MMRAIFYSGIFLSLSAFAAEDARYAEVVQLRGHASASKAGAPVTLAEKAWLAEGTAVETKEDGFLKLRLPDQSLITLARSTSLELRKSPESHVDLLHLATGKLRALIKKASGGGDKLILTTKSAAMGIRGTDFTLAYDPQTNVTSLVTIEGKVAMIAWNEKLGSPERLLHGEPVMVAAGSYNVEGAVATASLRATSPGVGGGAGAGAGAAAAPGAAGEAASPAAKSSKSAGGYVKSDMDANTASLQTAPAKKGAQKVPSYFLDTLKGDDGAFSTVSPDGAVEVIRSK